MVKFFKDYPYLFPVFNEKNLNGDIIYMNDGEIWYREKRETGFSYDKFG